MFKVKADHVSCKINFPIQLIPGQKICNIVHTSVNRFPVLGIHTKTGHKLQGQVDTYYDQTIDASKVPKIDGSNRMFKVKVNHVFCKINFPIQLIPDQKISKIVRASVNRFLVLATYATTAHKLQGQQTKESLFISNWHYGSNWTYVVLSRVTTLKRLFLLKPLRKDVDFSQDSHWHACLLIKQTPDQYDPDEV
jgi:hypothetical protein